MNGTSFISPINFASNLKIFFSPFFYIWQVYNIGLTQHLQLLDGQPPVLKRAELQAKLDARARLRREKLGLSNLYSSNPSMVYPRHQSTVHNASTTSDDTWRPAHHNQQHYNHISSSRGPIHHQHRSHHLTSTAHAHAQTDHPYVPVTCDAPNTGLHMRTFQSIPPSTWNSYITVIYVHDGNFSFRHSISIIYLSNHNKTEIIFSKSRKIPNSWNSICDVRIGIIDYW